MIPFVEPDPDGNNNAGIEGIAADSMGNVYGGQTTGMILHKYVKGTTTSKLASGALTESRTVLYLKGQVDSTAPRDFRK